MEFGLPPPLTAPSTDTDGSLATESEPFMKARLTAAAACAAILLTAHAQLAHTRGYETNLQNKWLFFLAAPEVSVTYC